YAPALNEASRLARSAAETGYPAVEGEALLRYGHLQASSGDLAGGKASLYRAAWAADAAADDRARGAVWTTLPFVEGYKEADASKIPILRDQAGAALKRIGRDDELQLEFLRVSATALAVEGKHAEAIRIDDELLALQKKAYGDASLGESKTLGNK